jgi:hypothetical protein
MAAAPQQQEEVKAKVDVPPKGALMGAGSGLREGLFGFGCGVLYGMTSPLIGHPFDTVKTKMQAQARPHPLYLLSDIFYNIIDIIISINSPIIGFYLFILFFGGLCRRGTGRAA